MSSKSGKDALPPMLIIYFGGTGARLAENLNRRTAERHAQAPSHSFVLLDSDGRPAPGVPVVHAVEASHRELRGMVIEEVGPHFDRERIRHILERPERLYRVSPRRFESFMAEIYRGLGYNVHLTKDSHDGGIDLVIEKVTDGLRQRYIVQCKHSAKPHAAVSVTAVRELAGVLATFAATAAILVTNVRFTSAATKLLRRCMFRVFGIQREQLLALARAYINATI